MIEKEIEKTVTLCQITVECRTVDKTSDMLLHDLDITVVATNPDDVERLFKFAKAQSNDIIDE